jgi:hypothetical protein
MIIVLSLSFSSIYLDARALHFFCNTCYSSRTLGTMCLFCTVCPLDYSTCTQNHIVHFRLSHLLIGNVNDSTFPVLLSSNCLYLHIICTFECSHNYFWPPIKSKHQSVLFGQVFSSLLQLKYLLMHCLFFTEALEFFSWKVSKDVYRSC